MTTPLPTAESLCEISLPRRRQMVSPTTISGALATAALFMLITNGMELSIIGEDAYEPMQSVRTASGTDPTSCECLLELQCPRYSFHYPQQKQSICKIQTFPFRSAKTCLEWRERHLRTGRTHVVLVGDLRLLYLYQYIRDQIMSDTERIQGPDYCKSVGRNWTHAFVNEESGEQPPTPCRYIAVSRLAKLEYIWAPDSAWPTVLEEQLNRCRHGVCPSLVVVSSRLDLALRSHQTERELLLGRTNIDVHRAVPLLERLRARGVHAWWKPHENLLDLGTENDIGSYNEVVQLQNIRIMKLLGTSTIPVWTSTNAIAWMHHHHCETQVTATSPLTPDYRCSHPYYLGNWAHQQYMDIMLNFLCGKTPSVTLNPCCAGWA